MNIQELSVGDWVATDIAQLTVEGNELTNAFVKQTQMPISIISLLGEDDLVFAKIDDELMGGYSTIYLKAENTSPIPLTPEILEKNGFVRNGKYNEWNIGNWDAIPFIGISLERQSMRIKNFGSDIFIEGKKVYVHQLQHCLRLVKIDKEIKL